MTKILYQNDENGYLVDGGNYTDPNSKKQEQMASFLDIDAKTLSPADLLYLWLAHGQWSPYQGNETLESIEKAMKITHISS